MTKVCLILKIMTGQTPKITGAKYDYGLQM